MMQLFMCLYIVGSVNGALKSLSDYVNLVSVAYTETVCFYRFYGLMFCSLLFFLVHERSDTLRLSM